MNVEFLEQIGLTRNEAKVYLALLELKKAKITGICKRSHVYTANAYHALSRLVDRGLVSFTVEKNAKLFAAESPENLRDLIVKRQDILEKNLPLLLSKFQETEAPEVIKLYRGFEGAKKMLAELEKRSADDVVRIFASHELVIFQKPYYEINLRKFYSNMKRRKRTLRVIWPDTELARARAKPLLKKYAPAANYKFLNQPKIRNTVWMCCGDFFYILFLKEEYLFVAITSELVADSFKNFYDALWESLPTVKRL